MLAVGLVFVSVGLTVAADDDAIKKAVQDGQGTWRAVSWIEDGKKTPDEDLKDLRLVIEGNNWTFSKGKEVVSSGTYKIVAVEKDHRKHDRKVDKGTSAGRTFLEIVKFEGDTVTVCVATVGKERPTEFASKADSGNRLTVWKRVKK